MIRASGLLLAVSLLSACGVGEATTGGSTDQQLGQQQSQSQNPPDNSGVNGASGLGSFNEGSAQPDAGTPPPPPPPPPPPSGPCPAGQTPVYRYVADAQANTTGQRISQGPGGDPMTMTCESTSCTGTDVEVVETASALDPNTFNQQMGSNTICVPPPPTCGSGEFATYVPPTQLYEDPNGNTGMTSGQWICTGPCDVLVQYGGMFGMRLVCAPPPPTSCPSGEEPIFIVETEQWQCQPACSGGKYDPTQFQGVNICVPC